MEDLAAYDPDGVGLTDHFRDAFRFNFYKAVKTLEAVVLQQRRLADEPDGTPVGAGLSPDEEPVRFCSRATLHFPASDLYKIHAEPKDGGVPEVVVDFMGLAGARGPLPHFYAELVRSRNRLADFGLRDFLDIFNHRLISLLYRVRRHSHPTMSSEQPEAHPFGTYLQAISGLRLSAVRECFDVGQDTRPVLKPGDLDPEDEQPFEEERPPLEAPADGVKAQELLYYAGLLWERERSMMGLERMLSHYFGFPVRGEEMCGAWIRLTDDACTKLTVGFHNNRLGQTAIAGRRVWDPQAGFELHIGPCMWDRFIDLMPGGNAFAKLIKITRFYVRGAFDFHLRLSVWGDEVYPARLPITAGKGAPRLGWTSWVLTKPHQAERLTMRLPGRPRAEGS